MNRLEKMEHGFFENCRIIVAEKFGVPPDDVDIHAIMDCSKRSIQNNCQDEKDQYRIEAVTRKEREALYSFVHGVKIVDMVFQKEYPFCEWVDQYQEDYVINFLKSNPYKGPNKKKNHDR